MTSSCSTLPASSRSPANHFEISTILLNTWIQLVMNGVSLPSEDHRWFQLSPNSQTWKEHYEPYDELLRVNHVYNWHNVTTWKVCKIIKSTFAWNICTFQTCCSFWFLPFDDFPVLSLLPSQCCPTPRDPRRLSHWTFSSLISDHSKGTRNGMLYALNRNFMLWTIPESPNVISFSYSGWSNQPNSTSISRILQDSRMALDHTLIRT